jgi:hypothetical protein
MYGIPYKFPLGQVLDKGIKLAFGQAPVQKYIDELLTLIEQRKIKIARDEPGLVLARLRQVSCPYKVLP